MSVVEQDADLLSTIGSGPFGLQLSDDGIVNVEPVESFSAAARDLDGLLLLGYLTDDFSLYGHTFSIRTLRRGEKLAVSQMIQEYTETIGIGDAISAVTVAACVMLVDDRPLTTPMGPGEQTDPSIWIRRAYGVVKQWYDPIIDAVWDKYNDLLVRQAQAFRELEGKS